MNLMRKLNIVLSVFTRPDQQNDIQDREIKISKTSQTSKTSKDVVYHTKKIDDGVILHAFSWSFNTIKEKLPEIKKAGYTAVQTSPIQECFVGDNGNKYFGNWVFEYQPVSQNIGNYIVGTEDEFKSLCSEAKKYGIKIIVDAVLNHMTTDINNCAEEWKDPKWYHEPRGIDNWGDRYHVTQRDLVGLRDINTQNPEYHQKVLSMLKRIVSDGASGFRYDTAKHIELPDDPDYGSQFWPTVLGNGSEFQYGELLQDGTSRDVDYAKYMKITASNYGDNIVDAINNNDFSVNRVLQYDTNVEPSKLITWVESHDNYSNDDKKTVYLTSDKIRLAWALLAARKSTTPLFFSRPYGGGGENEQFPNKSQLGDEGDPLYKDDSVAAVNIFRNTMVGEEENLRNPNGDTNVLMIERGNKGITIINLKGENYDINSETNLADGEYENRVNNHNKFTVSEGRITGTLEPRSVTVLYY
ncbi:glycoside hydrolase family 13 protein [Piromyces sp. E2]|nr:glycoside hydrolase family 13 protein [Piromyces sp. E2]|eukprot:OUM60259.1 glycoside hydrolase family 13 protein [Piromyces sp. E2]